MAVNLDLISTDRAILTGHPLTYGIKIDGPVIPNKPAAGYERFSTGQMISEEIEVARRPEIYDDNAEKRIR